MCPAKATEPAATNNYDADVTPELRAFMLESWAERPVEPISPLEIAGWTAPRRKALSAAFPGDVLIIPSGRLKFRSNDTNYRFRARSEYVWCTGHQDDGGVLVLAPRARGHVATLFVRPRAAAGTEPFYRDRNYGELWVGPKSGVGETERLLGIACRPFTDLASFLAKLAGKPVRCIRGVDPGVDKLAGRARKTADNALSRYLSEARLIKDEWEISELQQAVDATKKGFEDVLREIPKASGERWLEGTFTRRARHEGNDVGYNSIVACGDHACILHWTDNDGAIVPGELGLLDMGVEGKNLYTADVTRTIPLSGTFTKPQKRVYRSVMRAQQAGIDAAVAGASFLAPHEAAMRSIVADLVDWGLLAGEIDDLMKTETYRRYTLHGTSHMLGIDVHDCAQARNELYKGGVLAAGMVLTVEPGLYFQRDDLTVPEDLRGIGVRIEDDIVITDGAAFVLSGAIPKKPGDVERWMRSAQKSRTKTSRA
jgi:Xaa-Pro aminopeptidase